MDTYIKELKIGTVTLSNNLILAPMAGVTDLSFRMLCKEFGAGMTCTEMISAKALQYGNKKCRQLLETGEGERPVSVQLFGSDINALRAAVEILNEEDFAILDFNMGCPMPKIVNNNEGSALMQKPLEVERIVKALVNTSNKPVTVKIRKGFTEDNANAVLIAKVIEASGASAVAVHGRTREQMYSGNADLDIIKQVKEAVSIPVIGNGDVVDAISALRMFEYTGCDGIMIARGARGKPFVFEEILTVLKDNKEYHPLSRKEVLGLACRHAKAVIEVKGEYIGVREMRKHIAWYTAGFAHSAALRNRINYVTGYDELEECLLSSELRSG